MAINLTVALTDSEQAVVEQLAARIDPSMTAPQIKAWAERTCKRALRDTVLELKRQKDEDDDRAAVAARKAAEAVQFPVVS